MQGQKLDTKTSSHNQHQSWAPDRQPKKPTPFDVAGNRTAYTEAVAGDNLVPTPCMVGRDTELKTLLDCYRSVSSGVTRIVLVQGEAGSGKSTLVDRFTHKVSVLGGIVIRGKYDQYRNDPYHAIRNSLNRLGSYLLMLDGPVFEQKKDYIVERLGDDAQLLVEFAPEWKKVIEKNIDSSILAPQERRNVLVSMIRLLLAAFASKHHPLIVFLDDLQWMDDGSIHLLSELLAILPPYTLFIGAFRDAEVDFVGPFRRNITDSSGEHFGNTTTISLASLQTNDIQRFLEEQLGNSSEHLHRLALFLEQAGGGNPLQLRELLQTLLQEELLVKKDGTWMWDSDTAVSPSIDRREYLYQARLRTVPKTLREVLTVASAIGGTFSIFDTAVAASKQEHEVRLLFKKGVDCGLLLPVDSVYPGGGSDTTYRFTHDTLRQAFYTLIPKEQQPGFHLTIARRFESAFNRQKSDGLFGLVFHYNKAFTEIQSAEDLHTLLTLNCFAGSAAFRATAWEQSFEYAKVGISILEQIDWNVDYGTALRLMNIGIEAAYLTANYDTMELWIGYIEARARTIIDKAYAWKVRVEALVAMRSFRQALKTAYDYCRQLGEPVRTHPIFTRIFWNRPRARLLFKRACATIPAIETVLPDPKRQAIIDILTVISATAYLTDQHAFAAVTTSIYRNTMGKRFAYSGGFACVCFAIMLVRLQRFREAFQLVQKAFEITDAHPSVAERAKVYAYSGILILHWRQHIRKSIDIFKKGYEIGYKSGSFENASYCLSVMCCYQVFAALRPLATLEDETDRSLVLMEELRQSRNRAVLTAHRQMIRCIQGKTNSIATYDDSDFSESVHVMHAERTGDNSHIATFFCEKMFCAVLFGDYRQAEVFAKRITPILFHICEQFHCAMFYYLYGLTLLVLYADEGRAAVRKDVDMCIQSLTVFSRSCSVNFEHRRLVLLAERTNAEGRLEEAFRLYLSALKAAEENGSFFDQGIINERLAHCFQQLNMVEARDGYLRSAYSCYARWEANGKTEQLITCYPDVFLQENPERRRECEGGNGGSCLKGEFAIISTSQAISQELYIDSILRRFIRTVTESTGAHKAVFFEVTDGMIVPRVASQVESDTGTIHIDVDGIAENRCPVGIVRYVERTGERVVCCDADRQRFESDPYVATKHPRRLMCLPVIVYRRTQAVLYLEWEVPHEERRSNEIELIVSMATQAALSLESARRYEREKELEKINKEQLLKLLEAEKMASIGYLIAEIAHEVNNPNQAIALHADNIRDMSNDIIAVLDEHGEDEPLWIGNLHYEVFRRTFIDTVKAIRTSSKQIDFLVRELRNFMRPKEEFEMKPIDVNKVLETTVLIASHFIKKATNCFRIEKERLPAIMGDYQKLQQVFLNLIRNACQALTDRDKGLDIRTRDVPDNKHVLVSIRDEGCGINPDQLANVCEPFFSSKQNQGGMGLGLYICQSIVTEHGGELRIESKPGTGTTVTVVLPVPL